MTLQRARITVTHPGVRQSRVGWGFTYKKNQGLVVLGVGVSRNWYLQLGYQVNMVGDTDLKVAAEVCVNH